MRWHTLPDARCNLCHGLIEPTSEHSTEASIMREVLKVACTHHARKRRIKRPCYEFRVNLRWSGGISWW